MVETQGWQIRRCLSFLNNRVINRPHKPRNEIILKLCQDLGIEWSEGEAESGEEEEEAEDECVQEGLESEDEEVDEAVEPPPKAPLAKTDRAKAAATTEPKADVVPNPEPDAVLKQEGGLPEQPSPASVVTPPPRVKSVPVMTPENVS